MTLTERMIAIQTKKVADATESVEHKTKHLHACMKGLLTYTDDTTYEFCLQDIAQRSAHLVEARKELKAAREQLELLQDIAAEQKN